MTNYTTLTAFLSLFGAAATASNLLNAWMTNRVRAEISQLKLEMASRREQDRDWLDERFMARPEIEQRFRVIDARLDAHRICK